MTRDEMDEFLHGHDTDNATEEEEVIGDTVLVTWEDNQDTI